ncbi:hypothetical protein Drose_06265 [Dactylosporangium roseum]|uniref:Terminase n=1 Tax=Dactylosporangium roseum TaxID=47989 RepID=A0ABY5Z8J0_9ACTN|nr:hypothetical protein [Dactylosporangium roseum]UWZ37876.1 hypothetical protein Drose_06265 [Dactylosporangium roseum]
MTIAPQLSPLERLALQKLAEAFQPKPPSPYLTDPVAWVRDKLGEFLWSKQREVAESVATHKKTAVKSCHNMGKTRVASRIAAWFVDTYGEDNGIVISTAPTYPQVHDLLWEEIRDAAMVADARGNKLPGRVLDSDQWKLDNGKLVGRGRKPANNDQHGFQGFHRRHMLVIVDEACGIPRQLWTAVEAITTTDDVHILAIGNPDDPNTEFGDICKPGSGWNVITVSAFDTPNFTGEDIPDSLRPLMLSPDWVEDKRRRWGVTSPRYIAKVLGEFPEISEDVLIPPRWVEAARNRDLAPGPYSILGVDVARYGSDRTVFAHRRGPVARIIGDHVQQDTMTTTGQVIAATQDNAVDEIRVDGIGVGAGVVDRLAELGYDVVDMQSGASAIDTEHFLNARAEWFWGLRERFEQGDIDLDPEDDELASQLCSLRFKYTSRGQIVIESKDEMKRRGLPSPDRADALMLTATATPPDSADVYEDPDQYEAEGSISPW